MLTEAVFWVFFGCGLKTQKAREHNAVSQVEVVECDIYAQLYKRKLNPSQRSWKSHTRQLVDAVRVLFH